MTAAERIGELTQAVAGIGTAAADGAVVDLTGLEDAVSDTLAAARATPEGERPAVRTGLAQLIAALDRLAAALTRQQHAAAQQRAAAAYGGGGPSGAAPAAEVKP